MERPAPTHSGYPVSEAMGERVERGEGEDGGTEGGRGREMDKNRKSKGKINKKWFFGKIKKKIIL